MSHSNNDDTVYAEADSQEETIEQLLEDLDTENGPWSPLFPIDTEAEIYNPWQPQIYEAQHDTTLDNVPIETICHYVSQTVRRRTTERDIAHQEFANIQADFVEEVSQRLEVERRANFQQRQIAVLERQNGEERRRNVEHEEREERQADVLLVIETKYQQELARKDEHILVLEEQVRHWMSTAIDMQERDNRQLDYINAAEARYWNDVEKMEERIRELESGKTERSKLSRWAKLRTRRAKRHTTTKSLS